MSGAHEAKALRWNDFDGLVEALKRENPATDPRGIPLEELQALTIALPEFADDPAAGNAGHLETIRSMWWWGGNYDEGGS